MEAEKLKEYLFSETTNLYCVLDGASVPDLPLRLYETSTVNYCLFRGELPPDLVHAAPYLAILLPGSDFTEWVFNESSANHWGIFFNSPYSINEMRSHCRDLIKVQDEKGTPLIFRFYDPRVLRKFLLTCNRKELKTLFGNIETFFAETEDGQILSAYSLEDEKLKQNDFE
jgi:Domain of unknown function (DUF4123)